MLEQLWNANLKRGRETRRSLKEFAEEYNIPVDKLRRELLRGMAGKPFYDHIKGEMFYYEYSALRAQRDADAKAANKGPRSKITNRFAEVLVKALKEGKSVAYCLYECRQAGWENLPSQRAVYYHLKDGIIVLPEGRLRYRPRKAKPALKCRVPRKCFFLRSIEDREACVKERKRSGDLEMDCIVSGREGKGGCLIFVDRMTRYLIMRKLSTISQKAVHRRIRKIMKENVLGKVKTVTTDRGCEFLDQKKLESLFDAKVYYAHPFCPSEKGSVENINGLIRFWIPKGTDISRLSNAEIQRVQDFINSIPRSKSLKGLTANEAQKAAIANNS